MVFSELILDELTSIVPDFALVLFLVKRIYRERHVIGVDDAHSITLIVWLSPIIHVDFLVNYFNLMSQMPVVDIGLPFEGLDWVVSLVYVIYVGEYNLVLPVITSQYYDRIIFAFMMCTRRIFVDPKGCLDFVEIQLLCLIKYGCIQISQSENSESTDIANLFVQESLLLDHNELL